VQGPSLYNHFFQFKCGITIQMVPLRKGKIPQLWWLVYDLFSSLHTCTISKLTRGGCHIQVMVVQIRGIKNAHKILARKSQETRWVWRHGHKSTNNIKIGIKQTKSKRLLNWTGSLEGFCEHSHKSPSSMKIAHFLISCVLIKVIRKTLYCWAI
jgi:hypothetical protein